MRLFWVRFLFGLSCAILLVDFLTNLHKRANVSPSHKLTNLNSVYFEDSLTINFTSYLETDEKGTFIWLSDGSEVINLIDQDSNFHSVVEFEFTPRPCRDFVPLKINFGAKSIDIESSKKVEFKLEKNSQNSIVILPSGVFSQCKINGDDRSFFGKLYIL
jgi:hypothetical protein